MRHSVRPARASEFADLLALWERSVRATHYFVTEEEIAIYAPLVYASFQPAEVWVVEMPEQNPAGFILLDGNKVEALFLDPSFLRQGLGQAMIAHARALKGPLQVDVNEENVAAGAFYESCGFIRQGRSACDSAGKPHALLHLAQTT